MSIIQDSRVFTESIAKLVLKPLPEPWRNSLRKSRDEMMGSWRNGKQDLNGAMIMFSYSYILAAPNEVESEARRFLGVFVEHYRKSANVSEAEAIQLVDEALISLVNSAVLQLNGQVTELQLAKDKQLETINRLNNELENLKNSKMDIAIVEAHNKAPVAPMVPAAELDKLQEQLRLRNEEIAALKRPLIPAAKVAEGELNISEVMNAERRQEFTDALTEMGIAVKDTMAEVEYLNIGNSMTGAEIAVNDRKRRLIIRALGSIGVDIESLRDSV